MKMSDKIYGFIKPFLLGGVGVGSLLLLMVACTADEQTNNGADPMELKGIDATIDNGSSTRAEGSPITDFKLVGKTEFIDNDIIYMTAIKRNEHEEGSFSLTNKEMPFKRTNKVWERTTNDPERIQWSDPSSSHTIIAYCLPQGYENANKWKKDDSTPYNIYYGAIGNATDDADATKDYVDFTGSDDAKIENEDVLTCYSGSITPNVNAILLFRHALSLVRVVVDIQKFSSGGSDADKTVRVENMVLKNMPTIYKWAQDAYSVSSPESTDEATIKAKLGNTVAYDQTKSFKLWYAGDTGDGVNKKFVFYAIARPGIHNELNLDFDVNYQDPTKPVNGETNRKTDAYKANIANATDDYKVHFTSGKCTQINISVNHQNGQMTMGVEYVDWQYADDQSLSKLQKYSPYLTTNDTRTVKCSNDGVTADNATWLYIDTDNNNKLKDLDGNDGSKGHPYVIHSANQFLSFKKEVDKGNNFSGKFIVLDTNLTMQESTSATSVEWESIGKVTINGATTIREFDGELICHGSISRLKGEPLFAQLGTNAHIQDLRISTLGITGTGATGALASICKGRVCACIVSGNIEGGDYTGSVAGIVDGGTLFACSHIGDVTSTGDHAGGIAGMLTGTTANQGIMAIAYHAGVVTSASKYGGIVGEEVNADNVNFYGCYYDNSLFTSNVSNPTYVTGVSTTDMQMPSFVGSKDSSNKGTSGVGLNGALHTWVDIQLTNGTITSAQAEHYNSHYYQYVPLNYPKAY